MVAVKLLHDAEVGGMNFVREIAILKGCRHTNIVQFQASANFSLQVLWSCIDCGARAVSVLLKHRSAGLYLKDASSSMSILMMLRLERKRTCGFVSAGCMHIWQQDHVGDGVRGGRGLVAEPAAAGLPCWEVVSARQESGLGYRQRPLLFACPLHCVSSYPLAPETLLTTL